MVTIEFERHEITQSWEEATGSGEGEWIGTAEASFYLAQPTIQSSNSREAEARPLQ